MVVAHGRPIQSNGTPKAYIRVHPWLNAFPSAAERRWRNGLCFGGEQAVFGPWLRTVAEPGSRD